MSYDLDVITSGGGLRYNGTAGESLTAYQVVYVAGDGRWYLADADVLTSAPLVGLTVDPAIAGQKCRILIKGVVCNMAWTWSEGQELYLSQTAGAMTQTVPSGSWVRAQRVAVAFTSNIIYFDTESIKDSPYGSLSDIIIYDVEGGDCVAAMGSSIIDQDPDFATVFASAIAALPNTNDKGGHIHVKTPMHQANTWWLVTQRITVDRAVKISGSGRNRVILRFDANVDDYMFYLFAGGSVYITEFDNIKLDGNRANNTTGSGIRNEDHGEVLLNYVEIRDFDDYLFEGRATGGYYQMHGCFFLGCTNGMYFRRGGDFIVESNFFNTKFAFYAGGNAKNGILHGNRFYNSGQVYIEDFDGRLSIADNFWWGDAAMVTPAIDFVAQGAPFNAYTTIHGNRFYADGGNPLAVGVAIGTDMDHIHITDNEFINVTSPITCVTAANQNGRIQHNPWYNPIGVEATPFDNVNHLISDFGTAAGPTVANTDYRVLMTPCRIISTGGTAVNITIKDQAGTTISSPGATCDVWMEPRWIINFGNFSAVPTVVVAFK